eukprot:13038001-Heterocapsa_arctica.AAC.1
MSTASTCSGRSAGVDVGDFQIGAVDDASMMTCCCLLIRGSLAGRDPWTARRSFRRPEAASFRRCRRRIRSGCATSSPSIMAWRFSTECR